jgi:hypothetical protein
MVSGCAHASTLAKHIVMQTYGSNIERQTINLFATRRRDTIPYLDIRCMHEMKKVDLAAVLEGVPHSLSLEAFLTRIKLG